MWNLLPKSLLRISAEEASFRRRGFAAGRPEARVRLERVIEVFIEGYNLTLEGHSDAQLVSLLETRLDAHHLGFAFEGVGMCHALRDLLQPWKPSRLRQATDGALRAHDYIATVGAGFAAARLPWGARCLDGLAHRLDPMLGWCIWDGYGFHQGFFHHRAYVEECRQPPGHFESQARQLFDSGVGRSLWWVTAGSPSAIQRAIDRFPASRRGELWCGIGVAAAYAGGVQETELLELKQRAVPYQLDFLSGFPFATRMRQKGRNPSAWTERACQLVLETSSRWGSDLIVAQLDRIAGQWTGPEAGKGAALYPILRRCLKRELRRCA